MIDLSGLITKEDKVQQAHERSCEQARQKRDKLLIAAAARRDRYRDEVELGLEPTEPLQPLLEYMQALRDVPDQEGFPSEIIWPEL